VRATGNVGRTEEGDVNLNSGKKGQIQEEKGRGTHLKKQSYSRIGLESEGTSVGYRVSSKSENSKEGE